MGGDLKLLFFFFLMLVFCLFNCFAFLLKFYGSSAASVSLPSVLAAALSDEEEKDLLDELE